MDQSRADEMLTATLPAWAWRLIVFSVESHIDYRWSVGHNDVAEHYEMIHKGLTTELGVTGSGDLPVKIRGRL